MAPGVAIIGSCVVGPWCLMSPVFSVRGVGGGVSSELSVRDIGKEAVGNAVLDPSNRGRTDKKLTSTLVIQTF